MRAMGVCAVGDGSVLQVERIARPDDEAFDRLPDPLYALGDVLDVRLDPDARK